MTKCERNSKGRRGPGYTEESFHIRKRIKNTSKKTKYVNYYYIYMFNNRQINNSCRN